MPIEPSLSLEGMHVQSYHNGKRNDASLVDSEVDDGINLQFPSADPAVEHPAPSLLRGSGRVLPRRYEAGGCWETLIDHPSWLGRVQHYLGETQPYLHECAPTPPTPPTGRATRLAHSTGGLREEPPP